MLVNISEKDIKEHTNKIFELLENTEFEPINIKLTRDERIKLYDFLFIIDSFFGNEEFVYPEYYSAKTDEEINSLNEKVYNDMNEEIKELIIKCGVDPKKLFVATKYGCDLNSKLNSSIIDEGTLNIGDYIVRVYCDHPIKRDSDELKDYMEEYQDELYEKHKNGDVHYFVEKNTEGKVEVIYNINNSLQIGNHAYYKEISLGNDHSLKDLKFDINSGMMIWQAKIAKNINEIMDFFDEFERVLSKNSKLTLKK